MKRRILVVDDTEVVLKMVVMTVTRRLGYDAAEARIQHHMDGLWVFPLFSIFDVSE